uniref:Uncharacterized protein n=1 Tax=Tarenaya spinosa TaxID=228870 RepID=Q1KUM2_9ROSI|nr:hypothetical protein [Tarenaya spinosa]
MASRASRRAAASSMSASRSRRSSSLSAPPAPGSFTAGAIALRRSSTDLSLSRDPEIPFVKTNQPVGACLQQKPPDEAEGLKASDSLRGLRRAPSSLGAELVIPLCRSLSFLSVGVVTVRCSSGKYSTSGIKSLVEASSGGFIGDSKPR